MEVGLKVEGVAELLANFKKVDKKLGRRVRRGLIRAGLHLQSESQKIVPVDTGNLKASADTRASGYGWHTEVLVLYTAAYAVYVHERTELRHAEGKFAKFLERPAREGRNELLRIIAEDMRGVFREGKL